MTLSEFIRSLEAVAQRQPSVKMIVENDIFKLNQCADAQYGVFAFVQGQHSFDIATSLQRFSFSLFFVDRLIEDKSNQIDVQSVAMQTLSNILLGMEDIAEVQSGKFQPFSQRFTDDCAGMYCSVEFLVPSSPCEEVFENQSIKLI